MYRREPFDHMISASASQVKKPPTRPVKIMHDGQAFMALFRVSALPIIGLQYAFSLISYPGGWAINM